MSRFFDGIARHPWPILALALAATVWVAHGLYDPLSGRTSLRFDTSTDRLLPEGDPERAFHERMRSIFGGGDALTVALHGDDVFTPEMLGAVRQLTQRIERMNGVRAATSISNAVTLSANSGRIAMRPLFDAVPARVSDFQALREEALDNPVLRGTLISGDGRTALIHVQLSDPDAEIRSGGGVGAEIERLAREASGPSEVWITGSAHVKAAQIETQIRELLNFLPWIFGVLAAVLGLSFRNLRGVVLPLTSVAVALVWTLGTAVWIGEPLNLLTVLIPVLLAVLGISYAVHVVSEFDDLCSEHPGERPTELAVRTLRHVWLPVTLTGLTTGAGFFALSLSPVKAISEFGTLALIGAAASVVSALTVVPALLVVLGRPRRSAPRVRRSRRFALFAARMGEFSLRRRRGVLWGWAAVSGLALIFATQMRVASEGIQSFAPDVPVRADFEAIDRNLGGASRFDVVVDSGGTDALLEPERLRALEAFQRWLDAQPEIGGTTSLADFAKLFNRGFAPGGDGPLEIPGSREELAGLLLLTGRDAHQGYADLDYRLARIAVRASLPGSAELDALVERIRERARELPAPLEARVTGDLIVTQSLVDDLIRSQIVSLAIALAVIWVVLSLLFLSARTGGIALLPNLVPIAAFFGTLGLTGIPLNLGTSLVAPMVLGIAIDDTIHYFARFQSEAKRLADERAATVRALRSVGRPMTYTTAALCLGFLVLTQSDLLPWVQLGALSAAALGIAWVADFSLTPALCSGLRVVTMWDTLTLDLGPRPQESIPLFQGLTTLECRVAALIATIRQTPAGHRLLRAGEKGREMFLVIDGALQVSVEHPGGEREVLNLCRRGDVVGEVGFFHQLRSADVDVVEDARLLRLTQKNMEKLTQRYPRIAAKVLRNLSRIMAERLSNTTDRLTRT